MSNRILIVLIAGFVCMGMGTARGDGLPRPVVPEGLGTNIHFVVPNEAEVDRIAQVGYRFVRMDFSWGGTERRMGEYDFSGYDKLVDSMAKRQIRCLFIFDYSNSLYDGGVSPHTDAGRKAFGKWAAAGAVHFKGKGIIWEIWNEPNISQFWKPKPSAEDYAALALEVIDAVKKAEPGAFIIGPASSTFPWPFLQVLADKGVLNKLDAVSVHPYRQSIPETAEKDYQRLRLLIDRHSDHHIPMISGEWGYSTGWKNMTEEKQGQYLPRQWLTNLANDVNLSIWYDWKDDGADPKEPEHHFGSVYRDLKDKPSSLAAKKLTETLRGMRYVRRLAIGTMEDYLLLFADEKHAMVAAWTTGAEHRVMLKEGKEVELDGTPKYVEIEDGLKLAAWWPAGNMQVVGAGELGVRIAVDRQAMGRLSGQIKVGGENTALSIDLSRERGDEVLVPITARTGGMEVIPVEIRLDGAGGLLNSARVTVLVKNAISAKLLPEVGGDAMVVLENPSGEAMAGQMKIMKGNEVMSAPIQMRVGEKTSMLAMRMPGGEGAAWVEVWNGKGALIGKADAVRWVAVGDNGQWKASLEGDAKAEGEVKVIWGVALPAAPRPGIGKGVELTYRFGTGWKFTALNPADRKIPGEPKEVGMWVHGDASGDTLRCRFKDAGGQTFQSNYGEISWKGWKWVTISTTGGGLAHWGPGDGTIRYPVSWEGVALIDNAKLNAGKEMTVYIAGVAVRE
jgi:hypothetical protein